MWETVPPHPLRRAATEPGKIAQLLPVCIGTEADRAQRSTNAMAPRRSNNDEAGGAKVSASSYRAFLVQPKRHIDIGG